MTFDDIEEETKVGKKKVNWRRLYQFENEAKYLEWKNWAREELKKVGLEKQIDMIDMLWGLDYKWKDETQTH